MVQGVVGSCILYENAFLEFLKFILKPRFNILFKHVKASTTIGLVGVHAGRVRHTGKLSSSFVFI